jgi:hypothetical protein
VVVPVFGLEGLLGGFGFWLGLLGAGLVVWVVPMVGLETPVV